MGRGRYLSIQPQPPTHVVLAAIRMWDNGRKNKNGVCVYVGRRGAKAVGRGGGKGQTRSVLGTPQVGGHFITFLVDQTAMDTFFAHQ